MIQVNNIRIELIDIDAAQPEPPEEEPQEIATHRLEVPAREEQPKTD